MDIQGGNLGHSEPPGQISLETTPPPEKVNNKHVAAGKQMEGVLYMNEQHCVNVMDKLKTQRKTGVFCDLTLLVNGTVEIPTHRCVMIANSPLFSEVTESDKIFSLEVTQTKCLESLIDYMYTGQISVSTDTAEDLLKTAKVLKMEDVRQCCSVHLEKNISTENWIKLLSLSELYSMQDLYNGVEVFLSTNLLTLGHELMELSETMLESVLKQCNANMSRDIECVALEVLLKWTIHDFNSRFLIFPKLLPTIRPELISKDGIDDILQKEPFKDSHLMNDPLLGDFINLVYANAEKAVSQPEEMLQPQMENETPDNPAAEKEQCFVKLEQIDVTHIPIKTEIFDTDLGDAGSDGDATDTYDPEDAALEATKKKTRKRKASKPVKLSEMAEGSSPDTKKIRGRPRKDGKPKKVKVKVKAKTKTVHIKVKAKPKPPPKKSKPPPKKAKPPPKKKVKSFGTQTIEDTATEETIDALLDWGETMDNNVEAEAKEPKPKRKYRKRKKGEPPAEHKCTKCPKVFQLPSQLKYHMQGHGSSTPFLCEICGFSSIHKASMQKHKMIHNGTKLKCPYEDCKYTTFRKPMLEDHINTHEGIKNHVCSHCGKAFACRKHMQRHEKLHVEVKPIQCEHCEWRTTRMDKKRAHLKRHHGDWCIMTGYATVAEVEKAREPEPPRPNRPPRKRKPKLKLEPTMAMEGLVVERRSGQSSSGLAHHVPAHSQSSASTISDEMLSYLSTTEAADASARLAQSVHPGSEQLAMVSGTSAQLMDQQGRSLMYSVYPV